MLKEMKELSFEGLDGRDEAHEFTHANIFALGENYAIIPREFSNYLGPDEQAPRDDVQDAISAVRSVPQGARSLPPPTRRRIEAEVPASMTDSAVGGPQVAGDDPVRPPRPTRRSPERRSPLRL